MQTCGHPTSWSFSPLHDVITVKTVDHTVMPDATQAAASAVQLVKALLRLCILLRRFLVLIDVVRLMQRGFPIECRLGLYPKLCTRSG